MGPSATSGLCAGALYRDRHRYEAYASRILGTVSNDCPNAFPPRAAAGLARRARTDCAAALVAPTASPCWTRPSDTLDTRLRPPTSTAMAKPTESTCGLLDGFYGNGQTWLELEKIDGARPSERSASHDHWRQRADVRVGARLFPSTRSWSRPAVTTTPCTSTHPRPPRRSRPATPGLTHGPSQQGISHVSFCYDTSNPTPTPTPTPPPTPTPTPTPRRPRPPHADPAAYATPMSTPTPTADRRSRRSRSVRRRPARPRIRPSHRPARSTARALTRPVTAGGSSFLWWRGCSPSHSC